MPPRTGKGETNSPSRWGLMCGKLSGKSVRKKGLGADRGQSLSKTKNACLDRTYAGLRYTIAPRPARQLNSNIDFDLR